MTVKLRPQGGLRRPARLGGTRQCPHRLGGGAEATADQPRHQGQRHGPVQDRELRRLARMLRSSSSIPATTSRASRYLDGGRDVPVPRPRGGDAELPVRRHGRDAGSPAGRLQAHRRGAQRDRAARAERPLRQHRHAAWMRSRSTTSGCAPRMAHAVDRQMLVDLVLDGLGRPARGQCHLPRLPLPGRDARTVPYDPAKRQEACWRKPAIRNGHQDPPGLLQPSGDPQSGRRCGEADGGSPRASTSTCRRCPHDTYLANVWRKGSFYIGYWGMQATEDAAFTLLFTTDAAFADTAWNNKEFDDARRGRAAARWTTPSAAASTSRPRRLMVRDRPSIIPFFQDVLTASRNVVKNWTAAARCRAPSTSKNVWVERA